ncbi:MAG TPA: class I SAM-dependent methyltransferase [Candidatus Polarisedimenticolaceae bacterium]|nr:class I SAM-dependent methyltransferase [Candidatus Polarisedimenticolaceae bacterium]
MRRVIEKTNPFYDIPRFAFGFEHIHEGVRLLDYGCGDGWFGKNLLRWKKVDYHGVDKDADLTKANGEPFSIQPIRERLPFEADSFDVATIFEVLEHIHDQSAVLREIHRVLKPGGTLIVSTPKKNILSFLDAGNLKFVFPRMHRVFYRMRHSAEEYRYRYVDNPYGLVGNVEKEKSWHQHFTEAEMRSLLSDNGFRVDEMDGAGLFSPLMEIPPFDRFFPQGMRNRDSYKFDQRMLFCRATKIV